MSVEKILEAAGEQLYTLKQAREIIAKHTCNSIGHELNIVTLESGEPTAITCSRCGRAWGVR